MNILRNIQKCVPCILINKYQCLTAFLLIIIVLSLSHLGEILNHLPSKNPENMFYCTEPIDVVYTWVNGSDPKFRDSLNSYLNNENHVQKDFSDERFDDKYELKFSLRSLEKYAPWIRHVYIVTNGQIPYWLNLDYEKVSVVSHEDIFLDVEDLPSFSSPAIESNLHRIPGLSDRFIYFNDDIFLGAETYLEDFFSPNRGFLVYLAWPLPSCAPNCPWAYVNDGQCDSSCYNVDCQFDGGDCNKEYDLSKNKFEHYEEVEDQEEFKTGIDYDYYDDKSTLKRKINIQRNLLSINGDKNDLGDEMRDDDGKEKRRKARHDVMASKNFFGRHLSGFNETSDILNVFGRHLLDLNETSNILNANLLKNTLKMNGITVKPGLDDNLGDVIGDDDGKEKRRKARHDVIASKNFFGRHLSGLNETNDILNVFGRHLLDLNETTGILNVNLLKNTLKTNGITVKPGLDDNLGDVIGDDDGKEKRRNSRHDVMASKKFFGRHLSGLNETNDILNVNLLKNRNHFEKMALNLTNVSDIVKEHNEKLILTDKIQRKEHFYKSLSKRKNFYKKLMNVNNSTTRTTYDLDTYGLSLQHTNRIFNTVYGYRSRKVPAHSPIMIDRSIMDDLQVKFQREFRITRKNRLRSANDMQFSFSYYYYVISETKTRSVSDIFDLFDTDRSRTWSDREIRTILAKLNDLPLTYDMVDLFDNAIMNCSKYMQVPEVTVPPYERYIDSKLPIVSKDLVLNCPALVRILQENFSVVPRYKHEVLKNAPSRHVMFRMLTSNISEVIGYLDELRKDNNRKFICLNDNMDPRRVEDNELIKALLLDFYLSLFPQASKFELPEDYRNRFTYLEELKKWRQQHTSLKMLLVACAIIFCLFTFYNLCRRKMVRQIKKIIYL